MDFKETIKAITRGQYGNPFSILGMHQVNEENKTQIAVRAFLPSAKSVNVIYDDDSVQKMEKLDARGFFEAKFKDKNQYFPYRFQVVNEQKTKEVYDPYSFGPQISDFDLQVWGEGNSIKAYELLGAHVKEIHGIKGTHFIVCAPNASRVSVVGDFNQWDGRTHAMRKYYDQGLWEIFIPGLEEGTIYKYEIANNSLDFPLLKTDPYAVFMEKRPNTASIVYSLNGYEWQDQKWMEQRQAKQALDAPVSIYEVHLGSWKRKQDDTEDGFLSYREMAKELVPYVKSLGYTHIELLPVAEHPYDPSWGYQVTGYYAPTSRFGTPHDFMYFIDECHKNNIGVLVDWVPAHFAKDSHGLHFFDGTHLYEHADTRLGEHKDWGTNIFNFGRTEVKNFLISNAVYWFDCFHIDGIRVDAVASMLYLDYSREEGEWIPNEYGGRENIQAIDFLKRFNEVVHQEFPGIITAAEESTAWPMVSRPTYIGGLGFDYKWNMGWMNDTLKYFEVDPIFRKHHHNQITFSLIYAFTENFVLPLSHDEVVHMKHSMLSKMPGDDWQKFANLRLLYTYMYLHPGKKLLFMGGEFGQWSEWNAQSQLEWHLLQWENHQGLQELIKDLNRVYRSESSMYEVDYDWNGFEWIDFSDVDHSIISFVRYNKEKKEHLVGVFNFTPEAHEGYKVGVPEEGIYKEIINSDVSKYYGSNVYNDEVKSQSGEWQNKSAFITITIPPLAGVIFKLKK